MRLIDDLTATRADAKRRGEALDDLHGWLARQPAATDAFLADCPLARERYAEALGGIEHALGLFHHIGLERSYQVLDTARSELERATTGARSCAAAP